jgi:hypothetical protein
MVEGHCQLKKKVLTPSEVNGRLELITKDIVLSQLETGSVIGDEIASDKIYQHTVVVKSSEVRVLELVRFQFPELKYYGIFEDLNTLHIQYQ